MDVNSQSEELQGSINYIRSIPGLRFANQSPLGNPPFEGVLAGSSKSSFLKFVTQHRYKSAWLLEDDVFFTGDWRLFFDELDGIDSDVLTPLHKTVTD